MMRRTIPLLGVITLLVAFASPASAAGPTHERVLFEGDFTLAEGELCDFEYRQSYSTLTNVLSWGDPVTKEILNGPVVVRHENVETGYMLTEKASFMDVWNYGDSTLREIGLIWHLRDPDGKIVEVQAGLVVFDIIDWTVIRYTPNLEPMNFGMICTALGGAPA